VRTGGSAALRGGEIDAHGAVGVLDVAREAVGQTHAGGASVDRGSLPRGLGLVIEEGLQPV
jgi:hypothetical protein